MRATRRTLIRSLGIAGVTAATVALAGGGDAVLAAVPAALLAAGAARGRLGAALREVAGALARSIRDQDTLARVGGDEFCVLAPETDDAGARRLVGRVQGAVARVVAGVDSLRASAGAALFPDDGRAAADLLQAADQRLLGAKRTGGGAARRRRAA